MFQKRHPTMGARPGTLLIAPDALRPRVRVLRFTADSLVEEELRDWQGLSLPEDDGSVTWIDVQGLGDPHWLQAIAETFEIHPLAMEDVVNVPQRPKSEPLGKQQLVIARTATLASAGELQLRQLSIILGRGYVITFSDQYTETLDPVRERLRRKSARLRTSGADYLAYAILDTVVDGYYPILERLGEQLERLENQALEHPHPRLLKQINAAKNRLINLRRGVWPQRDAIHDLAVEENPLIGEKTRTFLRDTLDHCVQVSEVVDMYRDMATGLLNTYMSSVAHRSNEVMKVLTVMSSIFVPLTFLAGIYGMNFEYMPELDVAWAYPMIWIMMLGTAVGMLLFFRRKGWIGITRLQDDILGAVESPATPVDVSTTHVLDHDHNMPRPGALAGDQQPLAPMRRAS